MSRLSFAQFAAVMAVLGCLYYFFVFPAELGGLTLEQVQALAHLPESVLDRAYLPVDSANYLAGGHQSFLAIVHEGLGVDHLSFGLFTNISVILLGKLALTIAPKHSLVVVAAANWCLYGFALHHFRRVCAHYRVRFDQFLPLMAVNPLILFSLFTLNKEAIGLFLVAGMLRYSLEQRRLPLVILVVVALYTRNVLFGFGVVLLIRPVVMRVPPWVLLIAASLVLPLALYLTHDHLFGSEFGNLDAAALSFNQQTKSILSFAFRLMTYPFGYVVAWVLVTGIDIASPMLNFRYYAGYASHLNLAEIALQASSTTFVVLLLPTLVRARANLREVEPLSLVFIFTLFTGVFPFSQHRYLLPSYPLVALAFLFVLRHDRLRARSMPAASPQQSAA